MKTLIKNVNLINPYEILFGYGVVVNEDKIVEINIEDNIKIQDIDLVIDGKGNFLVPGFVDIHNHGNTGFDIMDRTEDALDSIGRFHLQNGVTSYLGTVITSSHENMCNAIKNLADYKNKRGLSQLIGIHLEGPFFSLDKKGAQPGKYIKNPNMEEIKQILNISKDRLKMVSIAPETPRALDIIAYLKSKDITVALAHSSASFEESEVGINYGATVATHLYNGMREFNHREPGIIGAVLLDERVYCEIIYDRIHLHDAAVKIALKLKGTDKIVLVSDAMMAAGLCDGTYELGGQKVIVKEGRATLETGNLAGSTLNLRDAVYNMVYYLNIPMKDAIRMASLSPAKAIGIDKYKGSIEIGKHGDMILIDKDINILGTMVMGKWIPHSN
ncbi:N-acetylglucosamine-6-phosphate deacetylase [Natronincola ferrireducens]|uniref:N-acetylglucosamine-6-phosphate deacetylase n=1 Tax=Natronincola ferrireducens TaxID=393762 RepID=A0A1G8Z4V3_9FIRM|nr:N-acetylglucosamine-6-phosphate deacetylase [Natronincola ferrireducens]SDK10078.1 N-acetylglucosamine-6-phosphate deacetylase [Natronincola ferrireducens]